MCAICGEPAKLYTCSLCARHVCSGCFDETHNVCTGCL
ncbi:MAG: orotate phosphoribosyltransferase [Thermoplasmata archaeon HGW-Thermoplasmata-1]|nr:MAG: orotate phosphoribosyltransferase [Thermoplasmata archaeon HGW-Thermoplasmata-1]